MLESLPRALNSMETYGAVSSHSLLKSFCVAAKTLFLRRCFFVVACTEALKVIQLADCKSQM